MALLRGLVYFNLVIGTINIILLLETVYQTQVERNCTQLKTKAILSEYKDTASRQIVAYPYTAAILVLEDTESFYDFVCASVIVSVFHSLTACHCIDLVRDHNEKTIKIRSGSTLWQNGGTLHNVVKIVKNEGFNRHYYDNDIAIISVKPGFFKSEVIAVAGTKYSLQDGSSLNVTGWGIPDPEKSASNDVALTSKLHTVTVHKINVSICESMINGYLKTSDPDVPHQNKLDNTQFCAESPEGEKEVCVYDSGSPAVQNNVLVGIVSASASVCGTKEHPGIYTSLGNLYGWLLNMTKVLNMQIKFV